MTSGVGLEPPQNNCSYAVAFIENCHTFLGVGLTGYSTSLFEISDIKKPVNRITGY